MEFLDLWRKHWLVRDADEWSHSRTRGVGSIRVQFGHCHASRDRSLMATEFNLTPRFTFNPAYRGVLSQQGSFAKCPSWQLGELPRPQDEAEDVDAAISSSDRTRIREARLRLIAELDSLQPHSARDLWLLGQRVRFRIDQGLLHDADSILATCLAEFFCDAYRGLVATRRRAWALSDSLFVAAVVSLQGEARCAWTDISALLPDPVDSSPRQHYRSATCPQRDSLSTIYWWLADPLLHTPVNERRSEHYARRTHLLLRAGLARDERYRWEPNNGGDAVVEMVLRYGWPSAAVWVGQRHEDGHSQYLRRALGPYSTAEYSPRRFAFSPDFSAVLDPFGGHSNAWILRPPAGRLHEHSQAGPVWWPFEHMPFHANIAPLDVHQLAMFRRDADVLLAIATMSESAGPQVQDRLKGEAVSALLLSSSVPGSTTVVGSANFTSAGHVVVSGYIAAKPTIVGVEAAVASLAGSFVRLRRGVEPPPTLAETPEGGIALSKPALFAAVEGTTPSDVHAMLPRLLPSTSVPKSSSLGVFWESYGIPVGDSVTFTVAISRRSNPSLLERVVTAARLRTESLSSLAIAWRDQDRPNSNTQRVPILPRSVKVDLRELEPGDYALTVEVLARSARAVSEPLLFTILDR